MGGMGAMTVIALIGTESNFNSNFYSLMREAEKISFPRAIFAPPADSQVQPVPWVGIFFWVNSSLVFGHLLTVDRE